MSIYSRTLFILNIQIVIGVFSYLVYPVIITLLFLGESHGLTCQESGTRAPPGSLPPLPDSYQVEVEANIIDKGYTAQATIYYSYSSNAATVVLFSQGTDKRYIFSYNTDEIFTVSGSNCHVNQLSTSDNIYSTWLLGFYQLANSQLHLRTPQWWNNFTNGKDFGENYIENTTVRGVTVDHWQSCGKWKPNRSMWIDYYFSKGWGSASTYPRVPVRTEIMAEKQLANGSIYTIHHIYDFFNFRAEEIDDQTIFQTPTGVICPGRKNTKSLPNLPQRFYVRNEIIYTGTPKIIYEDVWYDGTFKYYRRDYRPLTAVYPTFSFNPLTEIHDYYIGARYVIDKTQGNCTTLPLSNATNDVATDNNNGSYIIHLRNPLQLFNLDWNYTFVGQVYERGVLCDVYVTMRSDILVADTIDKSNTTIIFYFLAPEWDSYGNDVIQAGGYATPVKMVIQDDLGLSVTYNYVDFSIKPISETYDISSCYPEAYKLKFKVRFEGVVERAMIPYLKEESHMMFAQQLGVSFLRVQHIGLDYDDAYTYISATLLGKTPPTAQFEYLPGKVIEKNDDSIVYNVYNPFLCANYCINNQAFICNSFDFCNDDHTCRLSRAHKDDGKAVVKSKAACDHFSRSVNGIRGEPSIEDAFSQLRMKVYNHTLPLSLSSGQQLEAVDVSVEFGWLTSQVRLPKIAETFHYRIEGSIPALRYTYEGEVWYDKTLQLIRYDTHFGGPISPYSTTGPLTTIDDFSTGLQYIIDRKSRNCSIQAIPKKDFGAVLTQQDQQNSTWSLRMKTQYELLHIDNTYQFVGQQTVRGVLCNVFESKRTDFNIPGVKSNYQSVFKYFFLAKGWQEMSQEYGGAQSQPVRLEITVLEIGVFIEYNLYDFNSDRPDVSVYDIHTCFDKDQKTFQITFPGPYHPYLDTKVDMFRDEVNFAMSRISTLPPLRFQRTRIDYDNDNIYVTTTMVGNAAIPHYFTYINNGSVVEHADLVRSIHGADSAETCAQMCYEGFNFTCNSFYFCLSQQQCLFSTQNAPSPDGPKPNMVPGCESYSRTINSRDSAPLSDLAAFTLLKNNVYRGQLSIVIPGPGVLEPHTYTASMVRSDIVQPGAHTNQNLAMQHFTVVRNNSKTTDIDGPLNDLSVDDCALACTSEMGFQCQGFAYCDGMITCGLIKTRPDLLTSSGLVQADFCYIYQRTYLDDYIPSPGVAAMTPADATVSSITSTDACAKACSKAKSIECKSFEYCENTKSCLLFRGRSFGNATSGATPTCHQFKRSYIVDFQPVSGGTYTFTSIRQLLGVSVSQCAQMCAEEQGTNCHGFYFCQKVSACHLTSVQPGQPQVQVDHSSQAIFCNYYTRLTNTDTTPSAIKPVSPTKTNSPTKKITAHSGSATPTKAIGQSSFNPSSTVSSKFSTPPTVRFSASSNAETHSTSSCIGASPESQHQADGNSKIKTGTVVGVAFATFIIGLIIGAAIFFVVHRFRSRHHEEIEMHLTKQEHS